MGKRNRTRTRAIRAAMAQTGENYTRAAAAVGGSPATGGGSRTDAVRQHVIRLLEAQRRADEARFARMDELEARGHRIITGGQTSQTGWEIKDWNTDEVLAAGDGGIEGYDAAAERLDPQGMWFHADHMGDDLEREPEVVTPGVPASLGRAIDEWMGKMSTPDEEIAEFIGWTVEQVREYR